MSWFDLNSAKINQKSVYSSLKMNLWLLSTWSFVLSLIASNCAEARIEFDRWVQSIRPKLVVVIVVDQLRSEALVKMATDAKTNFGKFIRTSSVIPFARYQLLQAMTCPGHATILTGANPVATGIPLNDWFDVKQKKLINCVEQQDGTIGPSRLRVPTLSDELKINQRIGKVVSIAIKDRSAIMLAGQLGDFVLWVDDKSTHQWVTSTHYSPSSMVLPEWVKKENDAIASQLEQFAKGSPNRTKKDFWHTAQATQVTANLALAALKTLKLGTRPMGSAQVGADHLYVSFSTHDLVGHRHGPLSAEMKTIEDSEIEQIGKIIREVDEQVGVNNRIVVLTSDHSVAIPEEEAKADGFPAGRLQMDQMLKDLNQHLRSTLNLKPKSVDWFVAHRSFNLYLDPSAASSSEERDKVLLKARSWLRSHNGIFDVVVPPANDARDRSFVAASDRIREQAQNTWVDGRSGDLVIVPAPFWIEGKAKATHLTGYEYDRTVPIVLNGPLFQSGVYSQAASVNDIAPTLAFALGSSAPAASAGQILHYILREPKGSQAKIR